MNQHQLQIIDYLREENRFFACKSSVAGNQGGIGVIR
jgi:hypothetical protein